MNNSIKLQIAKLYGDVILYNTMKKNNNLLCIFLEKYLTPDKRVISSIQESSFVDALKFIF